MLGIKYGASIGMSLIQIDTFKLQLKQEALNCGNFVPLFRMREEEHYYILTADYIIYLHEYKVFKYTCGLYVCTTPLVKPLQVQFVKPAPSIPPRWDIL